MTVNSELKRASEWAPMRGFANMFYKENYAWWRTRRWWVNAIVWIAILCILVAFMLFVLPEQAAANNDPSLAEMGWTAGIGAEHGTHNFFPGGCFGNWDWHNHFVPGFDRT